MKNETRFRIGTRGSQLALWQANMVKDLLDVPAEVHVIKTSGDRLLSVPLQGRIDKGFFTKEIEQALMDHEVGRRDSLAQRSAYRKSSWTGVGCYPAESVGQ